MPSVVRVRLLVVYAHSYWVHSFNISDFHQIPRAAQEIRLYTLRHRVRNNNKLLEKGNEKNKKKYAKTFAQAKTERE